MFVSLVNTNPTPGMLAQHPDQVIAGCQFEYPTRKGAPGVPPPSTSTSIQH